MEEHFQHVKALAAKISNQILMASTISTNRLDSGKFNRLAGFGTFFGVKIDKG